MILSHWYVVQDSKWQGRQKCTLGYALHSAKTDSVNEQVPSFLPASLRMQTYPYVSINETKPGEGLVPAGDNDMLLYLQMTKNRPFADIRLLEYSGTLRASTGRLSSTITSSGIATSCGLPLNCCLSSMLIHSRGSAARVSKISWHSNGRLRCGPLAIRLIPVIMRETRAHRTP